MNKRLLPLIPFFAAFSLFASCADSDKMSGATAETNAFAQGSSDSETKGSSDSKPVESPVSMEGEISSSSSAESSSAGNGVLGSDSSVSPSVGYMLTLCDSVLAEFAYLTAGDAPDGGSNGAPTSSGTPFLFSTAPDVFFESGDCRVEMYAEEGGVRQVYGAGGQHESISLYYQESGVLLRVMGATYQGEGCGQDLDAFRRRCDNDAGMFRDLNGDKGCSAGRLDVACVSLVDGAQAGVLQREANLYQRACTDEMAPKNIECNAQCEIVGCEQVCDTACWDL